MSKQLERYQKLALKESLGSIHRYPLVCKELSLILRGAYRKVPKNLQSLIFQDTLTAFRLLPEYVLHLLLVIGFIIDPILYFHDCISGLFLIFNVLYSKLNLHISNFDEIVRLCLFELNEVHSRQIQIIRIKMLTICQC